MWFISNIIHYLGLARDWFYNGYLEVYNWVFPFSLLAAPLYWLSSTFSYLAHYFGYLDDWASDVWAKVSRILDWTVIRSYITAWLENLERINSWFYNWVTYVRNEVGQWWLATQATVRAWIDSASQTILTLLAQTNNLVASLQSLWNEFASRLSSLDEVFRWYGDWWTNIAAPLTRWWNDRLLDVDGLIDSQLRDWFWFYDDFMELWEDIQLFFTDPYKWIYDRLDEFFERFW